MNKQGKYGMFLHILGLLILPVQISLLIIRVITGKEKLERIFERLSIASDDSKDDLIWIHCASVGETVSAFSLIDIILKKKKNSCFLLTTGTITSASLAISKMEQYNHFSEKQIIIHQMLPVDNLIIAKKFITYWRPKLGIFIESELWPSITFAAKIYKIPLIIANGRMSSRSFSRWKKFGWIIKNMASCFDLVLAQSEQDSENFKKIGFKNVKLVGNLKYYLKDDHIDLELDSKISSEIGDRKLIFAASTHQGEERERPRGAQRRPALAPARHHRRPLPRSNRTRLGQARGAGLRPRLLPRIHARRRRGR